MKKKTFRNLVQFRVQTKRPESEVKFTCPYCETKKRMIMKFVLNSGMPIHCSKCDFTYYLTLTTTVGFGSN